MSPLRDPGAVVKFFGAIPDIRLSNGLDSDMHSGFDTRWLIVTGIVDKLHEDAAEMERLRLKLQEQEC